jgi:hypothetical protein
MKTKHFWLELLELKAKTPVPLYAQTREAGVLLLSSRSSRIASDSLCQALLLLRFSQIHNCLALFETERGENGT